MYYVLYFSFPYLTFTLMFFSIRKNFCKNASFSTDQTSDIVSMIDDLNNIDVMGQVLYNYFLVCFLLAGLILLIALIGSIVLTLRFNTLEEGQLVSRQLARTDNFLSFFK
jgi:NADH:ubiquinone oxidoreductase subunit 6 (subunit J)